MNRRGMALLIALWLIVLLVGLAAHAVQLAGSGGGLARNRLAELRGSWAAGACLAISLSRGRVNDPLRSLTLDSVDLGGGIWCRSSASDPNVAVDANVSSIHLLHGLLGDSAASAVSMGRPWASVDLLGLPAGVHRSGLTTEGTGRVNLNLAPPFVLAAIPGMSASSVRAVMAAREARPLRTMQQFLDVVSALDRDALLSRYAEIADMVTFQPEVVRLEVEGRSAVSPLVTREVIRLALSTDRMVMVRRMQW